MVALEILPLYQLVVTLFFDGMNMLDGIAFTINGMSFSLMDFSLMTIVIGATWDFIREMMEG